MGTADARAVLGSRLRRAPIVRGLAGCDTDLSRLLRPDWTVVDVGCGSGSRSAPHALASAIGVDIHFPSLVRTRRERCRFGAICASLQSLPIGNGAVDAVVALDVIEHFVEDEAVALVREFERVARRAIVLLTPNGFLPQAGTPENPFMEHRSGWSAPDLVSLGYSVTGINGWHSLRGAFAAPRFGPVGKALSLASQPLVRRHPSRAFHLLAVKRL
ncbi:MAG: class I SAM-dependent methyltransferase [Actinomycetota bacterium]|nr:class I SAM-dependent methyltransferase [Actinomycetota bacterium]